MLHDLVLQLLLWLITLVVPIITVAVLNWLKAKSKNENFKHFLDLAAVGVKAAEEKLGSGAGALS